MTLDQARLDAFVGRMLGEIGATSIVPLVRIGDELGLYAALRDAGPTTAGALAERTRTHERCIREWLAAHAAAGYLDYAAATDTFEMTPEQAAVFADPESPVNMLGGFEAIAPGVADAPCVAEAFRSGNGRGSHERCDCLVSGVDRFIRAGYGEHLVRDWLPALDGVVEKLEHGGRVADVGCGHGASTILMAQAFPRSNFAGFDCHAGSIQRARAAAERAGVAANTRFATLAATDVPVRGFDLVTMFDCLHDMGDPVGVASHLRTTLSSDGVLMLVEPMAGDRPEDDLNAVGRLSYAASTMICTPVSMAEEVGLALGAQAGEARLAEVLAEAGFSRVRRAAETPFNMILEARP
jgi:2-polyprenyl-3-methyl-5-hydroxy-6-metoxy-1,4-benzoquinol methylase